MRLSDGWEAASCAPGDREAPGRIDDLEWLPARVPGTAAGALMDAGRWRPGEPADLDARDWWFRTSFECEPPGEDERLLLRLGGVATHFEAFLNGEPLLSGDSMFVAREADVGAALLDGRNELAIRCLALAPMLEQPRRPRARWRTRLVANGLRFHRTMLLGRAPGIAPGPQAAGPWRPVELLRQGPVAVVRARRAAALQGDDGALTVEALLRESPAGAIEAAELELSGPSGEHRAALGRNPVEGGVEVAGTLLVPGVERWWPHTHGEPALHRVRLRVQAGGEEHVVDLGRAGFRELAPGPGADHDVEADGLDLRVNGAPVFARGAVWTPVDPVGLAPSREDLRAALEQVRDAGMNILRIPGTSVYEGADFHDLCDELGILVWQDFMFANLDYPISDEDFREAVEEEARQAVAEIAGRPSLAVLCGNSEVEQQVGMLGLDPALGRGELFGELLPRLAEEGGAEVPYVPSSPCGGELPFRVRSGIAHYFGVGGYLRPLEDARRAGVRFASECLAIANLGDDAGIEAPPPADAGADWDFADVRDHYLRLLFGADPAALRESDPERYLELSRLVSGETMAATFGEWRRADSGCGGGIVLWLRDLEPGAGWGLVDSRGEPKAAMRALARALAPRAVWLVDEGLNGVDVHVANDLAQPLEARLRVTLYRDLEQPVGEAVEELSVAPHETVARGVEAMLGRFADASWAFRFGPPPQDLIVAALEREGGLGPEVLSRAVHFPAGRPLERERAESLGLEASAERLEAGAVALRLESRRFVYGLRAAAPGLRADDDYVSLEPGVARTLSLRPGPGAGAGAESAAVTLSAVNLAEPVSVPIGA